MKIKELKLKLKETAAFLKEFRKESGFKNVYFSRKYRHMHIAYCLLRGKTYEQVENTVRPGNEPNMKIVEDIMAQYKEVLDENVCTGEA